MQVAQFITRRNLGQTATSAAFQKGDLSYSKARELTRVATPATEEKLLEYAIPQGVEQWADGGETNLDNTILLCTVHHRLLHEGGFQIRRGSEGEWHFKR